MTKSLARWLLSAMILWVLINENAGCLEEERIGLLELKEFLKLQAFPPIGEYYTDILPSWISSRASNCCYWEGITCDSITDRVTILSLASLHNLSLASLHIPFPFSVTLNLTLFSPFKNLKSLNLSGYGFNSITINVDGVESFPRLPKLGTLDLRYNFFNKSILMALKPLSHSLKNLNIANNMLEGSLPHQELSVFKNLKALDLSYNQFNGSLTIAGGPKAACAGCAGFAAFSVLIEKFLERHD